MHALHGPVILWSGPSCSLEVGVDCYIFVSGTFTAFTVDHSGDNLPNDPGPWRYVRRAGDRELRRSEVIEVKRGLRVDGLAIING